MQSKFRTSLAACVLASTLTVPLTTLAEEPVLQGRLVSPSGVPIKDFPVTIEGNNKKWVTTTDKQGNFSVDLLPPGNYKVAPANEPEQIQSIQIQQTDRSWFEFWKNQQAEPVIMQDIQLEVGKKY